jgi:hypothetical protein
MVRRRRTTGSRSRLSAATEAFMPRIVFVCHDCRFAVRYALRLLRVVLVGVVIFFVPVIFLLFVVFFVGFFSKTDIVSYGFIRRAGAGAVRKYWAHAQWYAPSPRWLDLANSDARQPRNLKKNETR